MSINFSYLRDICCEQFDVSQLELSGNQGRPASRMTAKVCITSLSSAIGVEFVGWKLGIRLIHCNWLERTKPSSFMHSKIPSSDAEQPHRSRWEQDLQRDQSEMLHPKKVQGTVEISWNMLKSLQNCSWMITLDSSSLPRSLIGTTKAKASSIHPKLLTTRRFSDRSQMFTARTHTHTRRSRSTSEITVPIIFIRIINSLNSSEEQEWPTEPIL